MSRLGKLAIAFGGSLVLLVLAAYFLIDRRPPTEKTDRLEDPLAADAAPKPSGKALPAEAVAPTPKPAALSIGAGWTIAGRMVRQAEDGTVSPAGGVTVALRGHPRQTKAGEAPPPAKRITSLDGLFEFTAVPGRIYMRMEFDEPSSALRRVSFQLGEPQGDGRRDLGDILVEPGYPVALQVLGPGNEPIEKAAILVGRRNRPADKLTEMGFAESRRESEEKGGGQYLLARVPAGSFRAELTAPGYATAGAEFEVPLAEPLAIRMEKGLTIAGTVCNIERKPIEGAEARVTDVDPNPKAKTDAEGRFIIDSIPTGGHALQVDAAGYVSAYHRDVPAGSADVEVILSPAAVLAGKVVADDDESPIAGARVTIRSADRSSHAVQSGSEGLFEIPRVPGGTYLVSAEHADFAASSESSQELKAGERTEGIVIRLSRGFAVSGRVVDAATGGPIADAQVDFQLSGSPEDRPAVQKTGKSAADGTFTVKGLREGKHLLSATSKGYLRSKPREVAVAAGDGTSHEVALERGGSIAGRILGDGDAPLPKATVRLNVASTGGNWEKFRDLPIPSIQVESDADGRYVLEGLIAHQGYMVMASHAEYAAATVPGIAVGPQEAVVGIDICLARGGTVRGRVIDEAGNGIAGANVSAILERTGKEEDRPMHVFGGEGVWTDASGNYVLARLQAGSYTVRAQIQDRMGASREKVEVVDGKATDGIDLVLGDGETIAGQVVDGDGSPVPEANVTASSGGNSVSARSDAEGWFQLKGLKAGQVDVNAWAQNYMQQGIQVTVPTRDAAKIVLVRTSKIIGIVRAEGRETFESFHILAIYKDGAGGTRSYSSGGEATGRFEVNVVEGTYVLRAKVKGFAPSESAPVTVRKGERKEGVVIDLIEGATVQGVVVAKRTGEPVEDAQVTYWQTADPIGTGLVGDGPNSVKSDAEGAFLLEGVPDGEVMLVATHPRFVQTTVGGITASADRVAEVRVEMLEGGTIRGTVSRGGKPAAQANVNANRMTNTPGDHAWKNIETDAEGRFELAGLPPGDYMVSVNFPPGGGMGAQRNVAVLDGQVTELEIAEGAGVQLAGRVFSDGEAVRGGRIEAIRADRDMYGGNAQIGEDGSYSLSLPGPGTYYLMVQLGDGQGGYRGTKLTVKVDRDEGEVVQDLEVPSGSIAGVVVDADTGATVTGAQVIALGAGANTRTFATLIGALQSMNRTDGEGRYALSGLPAGTYRLIVFARGYASATVDRIAVSERGRGREIKVPLGKGVPLLATVTDAAGKPVGGAVAFLRDGTGNFVLSQDLMAQSSPQGAIKFSNVAPGDYELSVQHATYTPARAAARAGAGSGPRIVLVPGGKVTVQVVDRRGRAVEGASVELLDEKGRDVGEDFFPFRGRLTSMATGPDGKMTLGPVSVGSYRAIARKDAERSPEEPVAVKEGGTAEVVLKLGE